MLLIRSFLVIALAFPLGLSAQDADDQTPKALPDLIRELSSLDMLRFRGVSEGLKQRQRKKIALTEQILDHPELQEPQRVLAMISRLQSFAVLLSIDFQKEKIDPTLKQEYIDAIEEGMSDSARQVVLEASAGNASFRCNLFMIDASDESASVAADAFKQLSEFEPKMPILQTSRRLLLEQLWENDNAKLFFEKTMSFDAKLSKIVLDRLDEKTSEEKARFLWAKHFARLKDLFSMQRIATMYEEGNGTRQNYSQAARWYSQLAQIGDVRSKIKLGDFYLTGKGFGQNPEKAVEIYRTCDEEGSRVAKFKLAECYLSGNGVEQSDDQWKQLIQETAKDAQPIEVQEIYTTISFTNAADSYRVFYETLVKDNPDDIFYLNNLAYSLLISSEKNPEKSLELIEKAIENAPEDFTGMSSFVDTKATALKELGKIQEAADLFESVLGEVEDKKSVLQQLVECYEKLDSEKADKFREQLEALNMKSDS